MWSSGGGNGNTLQYSCLRNPMKVWRGKRDDTRRWAPRSLGMLLKKSREIPPERMKRLGERGNSAQLWMCLVVKVSSVHFSCSVVSDSLRPHEPQHARPLCPSPTSGVYPNSCPLSRWCHPTNPSSVIPFSSCPQPFPGSGSFQMSQLFASGGQSIGVSASTSVLLMNTQDWYLLGWAGWISLQSKGLSRVLSKTTVQKYQFFGPQFSL